MSINSTITDVIAGTTLSLSSTSDFALAAKLQGWSFGKTSDALLNGLSKFPTPVGNALDVGTAALSVTQATDHMQQFHIEMMSLQGKAIFMAAAGTGGLFVGGFAGAALGFASASVAYDFFIDPLVRDAAREDYLRETTVIGALQPTKIGPISYVISTPGTAIAPDTDGVADPKSGSSGAARKFSGTDRKEEIDGTSRNDFVNAKGGNDTIDGGPGDDTLSGGDGRDLIEGGSGNDTEHGNDGKDTLSGGGGNDSIYGGEGDDDVFGGTGDDYVRGGAGDDSIILGNGDDFTKGDRGSDLVSGGAGNDTMSGGSGHDTLDGGAGNDFYIGNSGIDRFRFRHNSGNDVVEDFDHRDRLEIERNINGSGIDTDQELQAAMTSFQSGTLITFGNGNWVILKGVKPNEISPDQIDFI